MAPSTADPMMASARLPASVVTFSRCRERRQSRRCTAPSRNEVRYVRPCTHLSRLLAVAIAEIVTSWASRWCRARRCLGAAGRAEEPHLARGGSVVASEDHPSAHALGDRVREVPAPRVDLALHAGIVDPNRCRALRDRDLRHVDPVAQHQVLCLLRSERGLVLVGRLREREQLSNLLDQCGGSVGGGHRLRTKRRRREASRSIPRSRTVRSRVARRRPAPRRPAPSPRGPRGRSHRPAVRKARPRREAGDPDQLTAPFDPADVRQPLRLGPFESASAGVSRPAMTPGGRPRSRRLACSAVSLRHGQRIQLGAQTRKPRSRSIFNSHTRSSSRCGSRTADADACFARPVAGRRWPNRS